MLFMVIEKFRNQDADAVYRRFREKGRMLPEGVTFINSWVTADLSRCFQIMACDKAAMLQRWIAQWSDLVEFEIVPVVEGKETAEALARAAQKI
jgi:Protein of unknown function (DUF3303)